MKKTRTKRYSRNYENGTINTNMRKAGVDNTVIIKLTGHKTLSMFQRYNHVHEADAREAMRKLDGYLKARK